MCVYLRKKNRVFLLCVLHCIACEFIFKCYKIKLHNSWIYRLIPIKLCHLRCVIVWLPLIVLNELHRHVGPYLKLMNSYQLLTICLSWGFCIHLQLLSDCVFICSQVRYWNVIIILTTEVKDLSKYFNSAVLIQSGRISFACDFRGYWWNAEKQTNLSDP